MKCALETCSNEVPQPVTAREKKRKFCQRKCATRASKLRIKELEIHIDSLARAQLMRTRAKKIYG